MTRRIHRAGEYAILAIWNPKYDVNVGTCIRSAHAFGASCVFIVGPRKPMRRDPAAVSRDHDIPVIWLPDEDAFFAAVPRQARIVPIELSEDAMPLPEYSHPDRAVYVVGPEDGNLPARLGKPVVIPSGCLNVATAATVVLYDRIAKGTTISAYRNSHFKEPLAQDVTP